MSSAQAATSTRRPQAREFYRPEALDKALRTPVPDGKLLELFRSPVWASSGLLPVDFHNLLDAAVKAQRDIQQDAASKTNGTPQVVDALATRGALEGDASYQRFLKMLTQRQQGNARVFTVDMLQHLLSSSSAKQGSGATVGKDRPMLLHRLTRRLILERRRERSTTPTQPPAPSDGVLRGSKAFATRVAGHHATAKGGAPSPPPPLATGTSPLKHSKLRVATTSPTAPAAGPAAGPAAPAAPAAPSPTATLTSPTKKRKDMSYTDYEGLNDEDDPPTSPPAKRGNLAAPAQSSSGGGCTPKIVPSPPPPAVPASSPPPVLASDTTPDQPDQAAAPSLRPSDRPADSSSSQEASLASWLVLPPPPATASQKPPCGQEPPPCLEPPPSCKATPLQLASWPAHSGSDYSLTPCCTIKAEGKLCAAIKKEEKEEEAMPYPQPLEQCGLTAAEATLLMAALALMMRIDSAALEHEPGEYLAPNRVAEVVVGREGASELEIGEAVRALGPEAWPKGAWQGNEAAGRLCREAHEAAAQLQRRLQQQLVVPVCEHASISLPLGFAASHAS